jgi:hypothetical protein
MPGIRPARAKKRFDQARVAAFMCSGFLSA